MRKPSRTPREISIGPLHNNENLKHMHPHKFRNISSDDDNNQLQDQYDHVFGGPWKLRFVKTDMLLLDENQVPFFIIEDLL
ncbi:hypothetical protein K1719_005972 [Acacia pycnantha]|nr:hypothetical protein K1719_005972 [Acacia pycnantha]